jgi:hypothetical protein
VEEAYAALQELLARDESEEDEEALAEAMERFQLAHERASAHVGDA